MAVSGSFFATTAQAAQDDAAAQTTTDGTATVATATTAAHVTHKVYPVIAIPSDSNDAKLLDPATRADELTKLGFTEANFTSLLKRVSDFWQKVSGGKITFEAADANGSEPGNILVIESGTKADQGPIWTDGPKAVTEATKVADPTKNAQHVAMFIPMESLDGNPGFDGQGNIGATIHEGGSLIDDQGMVDNPGIQPDSRRAVLTLAHELGHNIGLQHAEMLGCVNTSGPADVDMSKLGEGDQTTTADGGKCVIAAYRDNFDIMGNGYIGTRANRIPGLLQMGAAGRIRTGLFTEQDGDYKTIDKTTQGSVTLDIKPITDASGLRAATFTDPATGDAYYLDYRNGTGDDADALYTKTGDDQYRYDTRDFPGGYTTPTYLSGGVRVLKINRDGETVLLPTGDNGKTTAMKAGEAFSTRSGSVKVSVVAAGTDAAKVRVTFVKTVATEAHVADAKAAIADAGKLSKSQYSADSWKALTERLAALQALIDAADPSDAAVVAATKDVTDAIKALKPAGTSGSTGGEQTTPTTPTTPTAPQTKPTAPQTKPTKPTTKPTIPTESNGDLIDKSKPKATDKPTLSSTGSSPVPALAALAVSAGLGVSLIVVRRRMRTAASAR